MIIKKNTIPTLLGIVILLAGTFLGVFYLNMTQVFRIGASPQTSPKDVRVSNVSNNAATISWITDGETTGFVNWGESQGSLSSIVKEDNSNSKYFTHTVTISGLKPSNSYFYKINSNGTSYDNSGIPWQFSTGPDIGIGSVSFPISGSVITPSGQPEKRALVYLTIGGYTESTLTTDTGVFVFQLGEFRSADGLSYIAIDPKATLLEISVSAGPDGTTTAKIFPQSAQPIQPMVLGQVYDLRNLEPTVNGQNPNVNLQLPSSATSESKLDVTAASQSGQPTSVIIENVSEGEVVNSTQPQFFGKGPGGESITITVHSETPISETVTIPSNGSWSWSPPSGLAPGAHSITVSWIDSLGITRTLTRNFIVQAGELPAFTASGSGETPTPTPTTQVSSTPIATSTPTATPRATATPKATATASAEPVPVTGDLTPTWILTIMGLAIMAFGLVVWKISET